MIKSEFMNEVEENQSSETLQINKEAVISRFNNWVLERMKAIPPKVMQANARRQISLSAKKDLDQPMIDTTVYKERFGEVMEALRQSGFTDDTVLNSGERKDPLTGESFFTRLRKEGEYYVAEEIAQGGRIISQSKITEGGSTQLTLHFPGERYTPANANPGINRNTFFPRTALSTFQLLVGTFKKADQK